LATITLCKALIGSQVCSFKNTWDRCPTSHTVSEITPAI
jgi:hypothetical protein